MPRELLSKNQKKSIETLGKNEVKNFENHLFDVNRFGGANEADALIERYSKKISLSQEDVEILKNNAPQSPKFAVLSKEKYEGKGCWKRKGYRNKVEKYFNDRKKYYTATSKEGLTRGQIFALKKQELENRFQTALQDEMSIPVLESNNLLKKYQNDGMYAEISADSESMDTAYEARRDDPKYAEAENSLAKKELDILNANDYSDVPAAINTYVSGECNTVNKFLRDNEVFLDNRRDYQRTVESMKRFPINRDLVVRRGVTDLKTAGFMAGIQGTENMTIEQLKDVLKNKFNNSSEMIMSDKAFISTSLPHATKNYPASSRKDGIGIEFVILVKKGTAATNLSAFSHFKDEAEVLLAPGTKFKVVDMQLDGDANIYSGNKNSWKIYLSTIPESKEGIRTNIA